MTNKTMNENKVYGMCLSKWGQTAQIDMCIEEMAELTKALCKAKRHKRPSDWLHLIYEEIADVTIMLEQVTNPAMNCGASRSTHEVSNDNKPKMGYA